MKNPQLRRLFWLRWAVRLTLVLGVAASVAANILHADPNPVSRTISAWPPLALLLTVELVSRIPVHRRSLAAVRIVATATIAGIAAWISYWHMQGVAALYGEEGSSSYLLPFTVDGLIVVASVSLVELAGRYRTLTDEAPQAVKIPAQPKESPVSPGMPPVAVSAESMPEEPKMSRRRAAAGQREAVRRVARGGR